MANFYVTHHRYPSNPQLFTIALDKVAGFGVAEDNPNFRPRYAIAEEYWKVFIHTTGLDALGEPVGPVVADVVGTKETVDEVISEKIAELCTLIDWSQQGAYTPEADSAAPIVVEQYPTPGQTNVSISSPVVLRVQEPLPGNGIDVSSVYMEIDGIAVVPSAVGNKFDMTFSFSPRPIYES